MIRGIFENWGTVLVHLCVICVLGIINRKWRIEAAFEMRVMKKVART
jgi:hypothetical protein